MTPPSPHDLPLAPPLPSGKKLGAELPHEEDVVTLGMVGLGRMGSNMARRLLRAGDECVVFDVHPQPALDLAKAGTVAVTSLAEVTTKMETPRAIWIMVPAAVVDSTIDDLAQHLVDKLLSARRYQFGGHEERH